MAPCACQRNRALPETGIRNGKSWASASSFAHEDRQDGANGDLIFLPVAKLIGGLERQAAIYRATILHNDHWPPRPIAPVKCIECEGGELHRLVIVRIEE